MIGKRMTMRRNRCLTSGSWMLHAFKARSVIIAAMTEWQKDWTRYMPTTELRKVDRLIMHGSEGGDEKPVRFLFFCDIIQKTAIGCQKSYLK